MSRPFGFSIGKDRYIQLRERKAKDIQDDRGIYVVGELASVQEVNGVDYATSAGIAFRSDHIPTDQIVAHNKAREAEEAQKKTENSNA